MAQNEKKLSVSPISAMIQREDLKWAARETTLSALPLAEQKKYLGLAITEAER